MIKSVPLEDSGRSKNRFITYNKQKRFYTLGFDVFQPVVDYDDDSFIFHIFRMSCVCKLDLSGIRQICSEWLHTQSEEIQDTT